MDAPGVSNKKRLKIMLGIICGLFFVLGIRLVKIMVIDGDELAGRAESQQTRNKMLSATRENTRFNGSGACKERYGV